MKELSVGFIGFGEAAYHIAKGLRGAGLTGICAYDANAGSPELGDQIHRRADDASVRLVDSIGALARETNVIFSAVTAAVATRVAEHAAPYLGPSHMYVDLNSTSPVVKQAVHDAVDRNGAAFVEAAVMAAVPSAGHRVPMLLCGKHAGVLKERLSPFGMRFDILGEEIGRASAVKMFRSIMIKGLEALMMECLLAASRYGAEERVFASLGESLPGLDWNRLANYLMGRSALHGERRAHEMEEVCRTLEALGIEPIMAGAAARRLAWCGRLGLKTRFADQEPKGYHDVLQAIAEMVGR